MPILEILSNRVYLDTKEDSMQQILEVVGATNIVEKIYWFVIDTDQYAGNFEREMCAFVVGRYGSDNVGKEIAERVVAEDDSLAWTEEAVVNGDIDDNGIARPEWMG